MTIFMNSDKETTYSTQGYDINNAEEYNKACAKIEEVLNSFGLTANTLQKTTIDINADKGLSFTISEGQAIIVKFQNGNSEDVETQNDEIRLALLKEFGYFNETATVSSLNSNEFAALVANGGVTTASASAELMMKSFLALFIAIVIILIYVAIRFEITSGLAAILALFHDVLITASVMLICRVQINSAFIAALITILGYSINNTIIIFDRIREELKMCKNLGKIDNNAIANKAVKQTMIRSILTTVTTFIMIFFITIIGVSDVREFAFPIMIGIIAGFYSSVFLTPGLWAIAYKPSKRRKSKIENSDKKEEGYQV